LTTYRVDAPALAIGPLSVRYAIKRPGQRVEEAPPAGEVQVPGASIAFRSVLPDGQDLTGIRVSAAPHARRMRYAALGPLGLGLVILAIVPVALAATTVIRRARRPRLRRSARASRRDERASLETLRAMEVETVVGRRAAFT